MPIRVFFTVLAIAAASSNALAEDPFIQARQAYQHGAYDQCISLCNNVILTKPKNAAEVHALRGSAYQKKRSFEQAVQDFNQAVQIDPNLWIPYWSRANLAYDTGDLEKAIQDYGEVIRLRPNYADAYGNRGNAYSRCRQFSKALSDHTEAIRLSPNDPDAYLNRSSDYVDMGDLDHAIGDYTRAIQLNPDYLPGYWGRGQAYRDKGDLDHALSDAQRTIGLIVYDGTDLASRGSAYEFLGDYKLALQDFQAALQHFAPDEAILSNFAWLLATCPDDSIRDGKKALALAQKACELTKWRDWQKLDALAAAAAETGDFNKAIDYQKRALAMNEGTPKARQEMKERLSLYEQHKPFREKARTL